MERAVPVSFLVMVFMMVISFIMFYLGGRLLFASCFLCPYYSKDLQRNQRRQLPGALKAGVRLPAAADGQAAV
jgi:hypothetical protein